MTSSDIRISRATLSDAAIEERIVNALRQSGGSVTTADIVARTGLPALVLEPVFRDMVLRYDSTVDVTSDGELHYAFASPYKPQRDPNNLAGMRAKRALWKAFVTVFKITIMVVLVGYVVVFVALAIMAVVAMAANSKGDNRSSPSRGGSRSGGGMPFGNGWIWLVGNPGRRSRRGRYTQRSRFDAAPPKDPRPFYEKIFSFVFGVQNDEDPLLDQKQLLAWIVSARGVISPLELSARTGWSPSASERESSKLIASFDGGVELLPDGSTLFAFDDLRDQVPTGTQPTPLFWNRWEYKETVTSNPMGTNVLIVALNLFVLFGALFIAPVFLDPSMGFAMSEDAVLIVLILLPALYVVTFFSVPIIRALTTVRKENRAREERNLRRLALWEIYENATAGRTGLRELAIVDGAMRRAPKKVALPASLQRSLTRVVREIAFEWDAAADIDPQGERVYDFSRIANSVQAAAAFRARPGSIASARMHDSFAAFDAELNASAPATIASEAW